MGGPWFIPIEIYDPYSFAVKVVKISTVGRGCRLEELSSFGGWGFTVVSVIIHLVDIDEEKWNVVGIKILSYFSQVSV